MSETPTYTPENPAGRPDERPEGSEMQNPVDQEEQDRLRTQRETAEQTDDLREEITETQLDESEDNPVEQAEELLDKAEKAVAAGGIAGGIAKMFDFVKSISERLDPIREKLARALGPMMSAEMPDGLKTVVGFSSLGIVPMLEGFTGRYGVLYKHLAKSKITIADQSFSAKAIIAVQEDAAAKGMPLPLDGFMQKTTAYLRREKGAGAAALQVTGKDLESAAKAVAAQEIAALQSAQKPEDAEVETQDNT